MVMAASNVDSTLQLLAMALVRTRSSAGAGTDVGTGGARRAAIPFAYVSTIDVLPLGADESYDLAAATPDFLAHLSGYGQSKVRGSALRAAFPALSCRHVTR